MKKKPLTPEEMAHQFDGEHLVNLLQDMEGMAGLIPPVTGPCFWRVFAINGLVEPLQHRGIFRWHGEILDTLRDAGVDYPARWGEVKYQIEAAQDLRVGDYVLVPGWKRYSPLTLLGRLCDWAERKNLDDGATGLTLTCRDLEARDGDHPKVNVARIGIGEVGYTETKGGFIPCQACLETLPLAFIVRQLEEPI